MTLSIVGLLLIILFGVMGYFRGILRICSALISFLLASVLAGPFSFLFSWIAWKLSFIPLALKPVAGVLITGLMLFLIFYIPEEFLIRKREKAFKDKGIARAKWESCGGAAFGLVWGFCLTLFILTAINVIGEVEMSINRVTEEITHNSVITQAYGKNISPEAYELLTRENTVQESYISAMKKEIDNSIFAPAVKSLNPVNDDYLKILENLMIVTADPVLFDKFQNHPQISEFSRNPKLLELSKDKEIQSNIQAMKYEELLNNKKIADLLNDKELFNQLKDIDIDKILKEIINEREIKK